MPTLRGEVLGNQEDTLMPADFAYETCVCLDHTAGTLRVDTTVRGVATKLLRLGFQEVKSPHSAPYRRFTGQPKQLSFRKARGELGRRPQRQNFRRIPRE